MGTFGGSLWGAGAPTAPTSSIAVFDLLYSAYRIAGILGEAERGYSKAEGREGVKLLNAMVDGWKAERLMVYAILRTVFPIAANQASYTIGLSGSADFSLERPERIDMAGFIFTNVSPNVENPLDILTPQKWAALTPKDTTSSVSTKLYYQPTVPDGTITLWPVPTSPWQIALYTWQTVNGFTDDTDPVIIAPAYQEAIEYNLAIRIAARFQRRANLSPLSIDLARTALAKVRTMNMPELLMQTEAAARGGRTAGGQYNIFSNRYQ